MKFSFTRFCSVTLVTVLSLTLLSSGNLFAQGATVSASELREAVKQSATTRQKNAEQVRSFFGDPKITKILADARVDTQRVQRVVSTLDNAELAKLAAKTSQIQKDFAAGALTNQELTYIVIALGAAVLVLVLVV